MEASAPQALGYVGVRAKDLEDWASYGANLLGLQRIDKSRSTWRSAWTTASSASSSMPTAARASASSAGRWRTPPRSMRLRRGWRRRRDQGRARLARARRRAARQGPDRGQRSGRQPAGVLPRRRDRDRAVQARPQHLRLPHRPARHGPRGDALRAHRRGDDVLSGGARLQAQRLLAAAVPGATSSTSIRATTASPSSRPARTWSIT